MNLPERYTKPQILSVADKLATMLKFGSEYVLTGDLGAGKTTLVAALVKVLNGSAPVSSPTYVLQHIYELPEGRCVEHWDLYRVSSVPEELLGPPASKILRLIEWGEKFEEIRPAGTIALRFLDDETRALSFVE